MLKSLGKIKSRSYRKNHGKDRNSKATLSPVKEHAVCNKSPTATRVRRITSGFLPIHNDSVVILQHESSNLSTDGTEVTLKDTSENTLYFESSEYEAASPTKSVATVDSNDSTLTSLSECTFQEEEEQQSPKREQEEILREYLFQITPDKVKPADIEVVKYLISQLTEEEIDIAAKANYRYYRLQRAQVKSGLPPSDHLLKCRMDAAMGQAYLYWMNYHNKKTCVEELKGMCAFRKENECNEARFAFQDEPNNAKHKEWQHICSNYIGDNARAITLNYDEEGRANVYLTGRFATWHTRSDLDGFLGSHGYMFERAIAATETRTNGKQHMVNVVADLRGFDRSKHTQPLFMLTELFKAMKLCYPERVQRAYMIDPPFIARFVFNMMKPLLKTFGTPKEIIIVNGPKQRQKHFGDVWGQVDSTENIDMNKFYNSPFDKTWDDVVNGNLA